MWRTLLKPQQSKPGRRHRQTSQAVAPLLLSTKMFKMFNFFTEQLKLLRYKHNKYAMMKYNVMQKRQQSITTAGIGWQNYQQQLDHMPGK